MSLTARGYGQPLTTEHCGSVDYIMIGDSRFLTEADLTRSPLDSSPVWRVLFDTCQFDAVQFGASHFDAMPDWRATV